MLQAFFLKLGITGVVIVILSTISTVEGLIIKHYYDKSQEQSFLLTIQNQAISEAEQKRIASQEALQRVNDANFLLTNQYNNIRTAISALPLAQDCPSAMNEVRDTSRNVANRWNKHD